MLLDYGYITNLLIGNNFLGFKHRFPAATRTENFYPVGTPKL